MMFVKLNVGLQNLIHQLMHFYVQKILV